MSALIMLATDAIFGDPRKLPHPVVGIGMVITWWERRLYGARCQRFRGFVLTAMVMVTTVSLAALVHLCLSKFTFGWIFEAMLCGWFLAAKTLAGVASRMETQFQNSGLSGIRVLIAEFVSRDTDQLTEAAILRAAVETMAENIVDGVLAPIFFFYLGQALGSPLIGIVFYKTINTLDSMVGYRNERYEYFGKFSAKIDDLANWIPARIGAFVIILSGFLSRGAARRGWQVMMRDRQLHSSPNSAYAEAAVSGLYGFRLGGPSQYFGVVHKRPWIGSEFENPTWKSLTQVKQNIWLSEILFILFLEGGRMIWG